MLHCNGGLSAQVELDITLDLSAVIDLIPIYFEDYIAGLDSSTVRRGARNDFFNGHGVDILIMRDHESHGEQDNGEQNIH
jgi:hypothetical protein